MRPSDKTSESVKKGPMGELIPAELLRVIGDSLSIADQRALLLAEPLYQYGIDKKSLALLPENITELFSYLIEKGWRLHDVELSGVTFPTLPNGLALGSIDNLNDCSQKIIHSLLDNANAEYMNTLRKSLERFGNRYESGLSYLGLLLCALVKAPRIYARSASFSRDETFDFYVMLIISFMLIFAAFALALANSNSYVAYLALFAMGLLLLCVTGLSAITCRFCSPSSCLSFCSSYGFSFEDREISHLKTINSLYKFFKANEPESIKSDDQCALTISPRETEEAAVVSKSESVPDLMEFAAPDLMTFPSC